MIVRSDRLQTELPPPSDPDPDGAAAVQELLGGRFVEMSTLMNYTFQSFNFRSRQGASVLRPRRQHRRFSPEDYHELAVLFRGLHPETGEDLEVVEGPPEGVLANDLPPQTAVFAPDYAPEDIKKIAAQLREAAGLPKEPSGEVANERKGAARKAKKRS